MIRDMKKKQTFKSKGFLADPLSGDVYLDGPMDGCNTSRDFMADLADVCVKKFNQTKDAFEKATFIWFLLGIKERSCFMKNHVMISRRLIFRAIVLLRCSYGTVPLNVIVTQMGSRSVQESCDSRERKRLTS